MSVKIKLSAEAHAFIVQQNADAQTKIFANIQRIEQGILSKDLFKKIKGTEIWELRTLYGGIAYRIMAFWDKQQQSLVIATHGFIKKTQKTPEKEIAKAISIMKEYYNKK